MTGWHCLHCGTPVPDNGDKCPNCEKNPFEYEKHELLNMNPREFWKFIKKDKLNLNNQKKH